MASESEIQAVDGSANPYIDSLLGPQAYVPGIVITYVLQGSAGDNGIFGGSLWSSEGRRGAFNLALQSWAAVANVHFQEAAGPYTGTGSTANYDWIEQLGTLADGLLGQHQLPAVGTITGTFSLAAGIFQAPYLSAGGYGYTTFVHEIGHGLGLLHPHNESGDPPGDPAFPGVDSSIDYGDNDLNQGVFTVMTYLDGYWQVGLSPSDAYGWELGPMAFDIAAIQHIYGANMTTATGANSYALPQVNGTGTGWSCIWDAGGTDTISAAGTAFDAIIDLRAATLLNAPGGGGYVSRVTGILGGVTIANGVTIENATGGGGDDWIHGNAASNVLNGGGGWDTVDYSGSTANLVIDLSAGTANGEGADTLIAIENARGGAGNDVLTAFAGTMAVPGALDLTKAIDQAKLQGTALDLDYHFSAHTGDPGIEQTAGMSSVTIHAATSGGSDWYSFYLSSPGTIIIETDNTFGIDTVIAIVDSNGHQIATNDDRGTLDPGSANVLDSYISFAVPTGGQRIYIQVSGYNNAAGSYDLNVSAITDRTASGAQLIGSTLDGGAGNDTLIGGAGIDTLIGGSGDDTYSAVQAQDIVVEAAGGGFDTVVSTISMTLTAPNIEGLTLASGAGNLYAVGNAEANVITGNEGDNLLIGGGGFDVIRGGGGSDQIYADAGSGQLYGEAGNDVLVGGMGDDLLDGGAGADALYGGSGNDSYMVDTASDVIFEAVGAGWDRVNASAGFYLYANVEQLTLVMSAGDIFGVGNALDNLLIGNEGANLLIGGDGIDTVWGGSGNDAIFGEAGADYINGQTGIDYIVGGDGDDRLGGGAGPDAIHGGAGNDRLYGDFAPSPDPYGGAGIPGTDTPEFVTDILVGGEGNDLLFGDSGLGDYDLLDGGTGDDIYYVDTGDDLTFEAVGGGTDWVYANVAVAGGGVYLWANVENLFLQGTTAFGVGNELDNILIGNSGGNWLLGGAGNDLIEGKSGNDVLFGEGGTDTFTFGPGYACGVDVIGDFAPGQDTIHLADSTSGLTNFAAIIAATIQVGNDCAIDLGGGNQIILLGVQMNTLTAADFQFG